MTQCYDIRTEERDLMAEVEKLRAQVATLQEAAHAALDVIEGSYNGRKVRNARTMLRAALAATDKTEGD